MITETTDILEVEPLNDWIFYDRDCGLCTRTTLWTRAIFARRGFRFEALQEPWVQEKLEMTLTEALTEMRVLTRDGELFGGAEAVLFLAGKVWWLLPLTWLAKLPGMPRLFRALYRWVAANRSCAIATPPQGRPTRWLPLVVLPLLALVARPVLPPWGFMRATAGAVFLGCKWLTLLTAEARSGNAPLFRRIGYLLAWPGMDADRFLSPKLPPTAQTTELFHGLIRGSTRAALGAILLFVLARQAHEPLVAGWIGMIGMVMLLHFGLFEIISVAWHTLGVDAPPIMKAPLRSTSVAEFWSRRWNGAFNKLAVDHVFRPLARRTGTAAATLGAFAVSGCIHELVISLPAGGGYGLPMGYFLLQGLALMAERTCFVRKATLGHPRRGWVFTMCVVALPAFWLFHPPFVHHVILPFMQTIRAL